MTVADLLRSLERVPGLTMPAVGASPLLATQCTGVTHDSRRVGRGSIFVALVGLKANGAAFAPEAIAAGASAIVGNRRRRLMSPFRGSSSLTRGSLWRGCQRSSSITPAAR